MIFRQRNEFWDFVKVVYDTCFWGRMPNPTRFSEANIWYPDKNGLHALHYASAVGWYGVEIISMVERVNSKKTTTNH